MARFTYPYAAIQHRPSGLYPQGKTAYRPLLSVKLIAGSDNFHETVALADSGADACLFPFRFARYLHLDVERLPNGMTSGVGSAANVTYYATITIGLGNGLFFQTEAGFTEGMDQAGFGLLGQQGFFESSNIEFLHAQRCFTLDPA